jgi:peptidoglycan/LPS O-acetylase OafA/YrhL
MRGGASLAVAFYHFWNNPAFSVGRAATPPPLRAALSGSRLGVEVFFAISGFVMAYTLRDAVVTRRYAMGFILRRSIRLDPPYWLTIALALLAARVSDLAVHRPIATAPLPAVLAHLFYLQELLGYQQILIIFWTLCLEVQFYLVLLILVWAAARLSRPIMGGLHVVLALLSVAAYCGAFPSLPGLFLPNWFMFLAGCTVAWCNAGRLPRWFPAWVAVGCLVLGARLWNPEPLISGLAVAILAAGVWWPHVMRSLTARPIQWLGRISYSLYLVHPLIGERLQNVGRRICGERLGWLWAWLIVALVASLLTASLFHRWVEAPCVALARRASDPWMRRGRENRVPS